MKANRSNSLLLLLFVVILRGGGCAGGLRSSTSSNNPPHERVSAPVNSAAVSSRDYRAPDNTFAIKIPDGWRLERDEKDEAVMTVIRSDQYRAANLSIMTINGALPKTAAELRSHMLVEGSKPFFQGWIDGLKDQARVEGTGNIYPTRFASFDALRMDITYYRNDADDPREGYSVFLTGDRTTVFISLTGSRSRIRELEKIISTMRIEP